MAEESSTPLFTVGQEIANFLISCGILSKAWEESLRASDAESFTLNEYEDVAYFAFPSFQRIKYFIPKESQCGEGNMHTAHKLFSGCFKDIDGEPTFFHPGALTLFRHIMEKTDFQAKLHIYTDSKQTKLKPIIFVGHSMGGAVATLATLWVLGKRVRQSSPFCITFGCPLVGDERLVEAVDREYWGCNFCHVVSRHDIVPRMLLAPIESIAQPFTTIYCYWEGINVLDSKIQDCRTLLNHVLVSRDSQYRPFGTYMFCSRNGAACIENTGTVLEMLRLTMQSQQGSFDEIVEACLSEHIRYNSVLEELMQNSIGGIRIAISDSDDSSYEMGISSQLEAIGVGARNDLGQLALHRGEVRNAYYQISDSPLLNDLLRIKASMAELEWYKEYCEKNAGITYYDSFKKHDTKADIEGNLRRVKLAAIWDEIVEMWESHELPRDFETQNTWINAGTTYRRLVEPLDIAYYYRNNSNGNYLSDGRPRRYKVLQEWMEAKEKAGSSRVQGRRTKPASVTQDSCFWVHVEEALKDLESLEQVQHQSLQNLKKFEESLQNLKKFEEYVTNMVKALSISSNVFVEESSFMEWWKEWKEYNKNHWPGWSSPLYEIMERENPFKFERIEWSMAQLEFYKESCKKQDGITYYDSFRKFGPQKDLDADLPRTKLAKLWDELIGMWESHELPSDLETLNKWINAGTRYRRLVEPLDIAHYYRTNSFGNYLSDGRPKRHKLLQEWMEAKEKTGSSRVQGRRTKLASLTQDSCFWAHVEQALKDLESLKQGEKHRLQNLENFEEYVTQMVKALSISSDVLWEGSSFMNWWKKWKEYNKAQSPEWSSPLYQITESESRLKFERINSSTVAQEKISSTGEVKESIPSNKRSDLAQLSSKESELVPEQGRMFELEWYKMICHEKGDGYYDSFKIPNDSKTNLLRVTLNEFWDEIIKICNSPSLPSDFQSRNKWINVGTAYRKLVEPLDIAQYYSTSKDSGNYLDKRPARYKVLEQWLEHRKTNRSSRDQRSRTKLPFLTRDSCFWARVEEALKDLKEGADQKKESLENFEKYVTEMIKDCKISSDVFLDRSSFMKWWKEWKEYNQNQFPEWTSPLYETMETESWKR